MESVSLTNLFGESPIEFFSIEFTNFPTTWVVQTLVKTRHADQFSVSPIGI